jgi:hypothetical protein
MFITISREMVHTMLPIASTVVRLGEKTTASRHHLFKFRLSPMTDDVVSCYRKILWIAAYRASGESTRLSSTSESGSWPYLGIVE